MAWHTMPQTAQRVSPATMKAMGGDNSSKAPATHRATTPSTKRRRPKSATARPTHGTIGLLTRYVRNIGPVPNWPLRNSLDHRSDTVEIVLMLRNDISASRHAQAHARRAAHV